MFLGFGFENLSFVQVLKTAISFSLKWDEINVLNISYFKTTTHIYNTAKKVQYF